MRIVRQGDGFIAQFSFSHEATYLAEQVDRWVPVFLPGHLEQPFAHIHSQTYEVRVEDIEHLTERYIVVLGQ